MITAPDRSLNILRIDVDREGNRRLIPFNCDRCGLEPACYGKNGELICTGCWQKGKR